MRLKLYACTFILFFCFSLQSFGQIEYNSSTNEITKFDDRYQFNNFLIYDEDLKLEEQNVPIKSIIRFNYAQDKTPNLFIKTYDKAQFTILFGMKWVHDKGRKYSFLIENQNKEEFDAWLLINEKNQVVLFKMTNVKKNKTIMYYN